MEAFVSACVERAGTVHVAFNNAGIEGPEGSLAEIDVDGDMGYRDVRRTNLDGVYYAMRHELPVMIDRLYEPTATSVAAAPSWACTGERSGSATV